MKKRKEKVLIEFEIEYDEVEWAGGWIPKTVYKYRNWENPNHRKILEELSIWVPDSYDFNDPFDCNIPVAFDLISTDDVLAEKFIRRLIEANKHRIPGDIESEIKKRLDENKHKNPYFVAKYKEDLLQANKEVSGVFSVTPINNNILMWSHYANSHKGLCIGFDSVKLFEYLGGGGKINYTKDYPIISPIETRETQYLLQVLTKSIHWSYEAEYRLTTFQKTNININIPPEVIVEVIFGARMPIGDKIKIKNLLKNNLPDVKCFSAIPDNNSFKINIVPESNNI